MVRPDRIGPVRRVKRPLEFVDVTEQPGALGGRQIFAQVLDLLGKLRVRRVMRMVSSTRLLRESFRNTECM